MTAASSPRDDGLRARIDRLVDERLDGDVSDADWQRHVAEIGPALVAALERETAVRASVRALPRAAAPAAVRAAILAHAARASGAGAVAPAPASSSSASPRIIRGGWFWSVSALAAACLVVALSVGHGPAGTDGDLLASSRQGASAPPAPEQESRKDAAAAPMQVADEPTLAILEQGKANGSERLLRGADDRFSDQAKEQSGFKSDALAAAASTANTSTLEAKTASKDDDEVAVAARRKIADSEAGEKRALEKAEELQHGGVAKVEIDPGTLANAAKDAKHAYRNSGEVAAAAPGDAPAGGGRGDDPVVTATAAADDAVALADSDGAVAKQLSKPADAAVAGAPMSGRLLPRKSAAVNAETNEPAPAEADKGAPRPAAVPAAPTAPAGPRAVYSTPPAEADAGVVLVLAIADGKAAMTVENRGDQPLVVRRATLVLEGLDPSQRSCWTHATGLPAADDTIAARQKRTWSLALLGTHAPPAAAVQLRVRLTSQLSAAQAWTRQPAPPAAAAAPPSVAPATTGP